MSNYMSIYKRKNSMIRIANYKSAKIVDIRGTIYMYMYKETCK